MPCETRQRVKVRINVKKRNTFKKALKKKLKWNVGASSGTIYFNGRVRMGGYDRYVSGLYMNGTLTFDDGSESGPGVIKRITQAYSQMIVEEEAERPGMQWLLKETGPYKYLATKPYSNDQIEIEVLEDGAIKSTVPGKISAANHASAEQFLLNIAKAGGGPVTRERLTAGILVPNQMEIKT